MLYLKFLQVPQLESRIGLEHEATSHGNFHISHCIFLVIFLILPHVFPESKGNKLQDTVFQTWKATKRHKPNDFLAASFIIPIC